MNQVFRISVGPETVQGHLPAVRVGLGFGCRFSIAGVDRVDGVPAPKIWISRKEAATVFWEAEWDETVGMWVATIGSDATAAVGSYVYALTMFGEDIGTEFIAGQGAFSVYSSIASPATDGTGETGGTGTTVQMLITALDERVTALEDKFAALAAIGMFDPVNAFDHEMRQQVADITNALRGNQS